MSLVPEVKFTRSGNVDLAYQVFGDGPLDILLMIGWVSHLEVLWELPECRRFLERYAAMGRVALFDKRGTGLSDRPSIEASTDEMVPDVLAVLDAVGMERAALVGWTDAAAIAMTVAAMHPQRVSALVLGEVLATSTPDGDHPWGPDPETFETVAGVIEQGMWGQAILLPLIAPSVTDDERIVSWFRKLERMSATPSMAADLMRRMLEIDLRPLLPSVIAPALLLHRKDAPFIPATGCAGWRSICRTDSTSRFLVTRRRDTSATWTVSWTRSRSFSSARGWAEPSTGAWPQSCSATWSDRPSEQPRSGTAVGAGSSRHTGPRHGASLHVMVVVR